MKYRIWSKQIKGFVDSSEWYLNPNGELFYEDLMVGELVKAPNDSYIIQRSTGMYDINDKLIFEGDMVKLYFPDEITTELYIVNYNFGKWLLDDCKELNRFCVDSKKFGESCKVVIVGNIFEN